MMIVGRQFLKIITDRRPVVGQAIIQAGARRALGRAASTKEISKKIACSWLASELIDLQPPLLLLLIITCFFIIIASY
jgi:hypothetical protein